MFLTSINISERRKFIPSASLCSPVLFFSENVSLGNVRSRSYNNVEASSLSSLEKFIVGKNSAHADCALLVLNQTPVDIRGDRAIA